MVVSTKVLDVLKSIGLNLYERKIFVALLAKGIATAGEVSSIANVPRSRSYDILESLAEKGFVVLQPSKPIKYIALEPSDALERVKANLAKKHDEVTKRIDSLEGSSTLTELQALFKQGFSMVQPFEMTGTIKGEHGINQQLKSIFKKAKSNVNVVTTQKGLADLCLNHFNALKKSTKKGIKLKVLAHNGDKEHVDKLSKIAEVKHLDSPSGRMFLVDNDHVVLSLTDDTAHSTQDASFWANSKHLVDGVFGPMFNQLWSSSK